MRITIDPTLAQLMRDVSAGIRVLHSRDGVVLSEGQILERARNIVMGLLGNYRIETLERPHGEPPEAAMSEAAMSEAAMSAAAMEG